MAVKYHKATYEMVARVLRENLEAPKLGDLAQEFARVFMADNPLFDRHRFLEACLTERRGFLPLRSGPKGRARTLERETAEGRQTVGELTTKARRRPLLVINYNGRDYEIEGWHQIGNAAPALMLRTPQSLLRFIPLSKLLEDG